MNILTEDQARQIALESGKQAIRLFIDQYFPDFPNVASIVEADQRFTVKQLAEYWQRHEQTIMQKKRKGELPFIQHGRKLLFSKNAIDKLTANPVSKSGR